jgi:hypothetical protein
LDFLPALRQTRRARAFFMHILTNFYPFLLDFYSWKIPLNIYEYLKLTRGQPAPVRYYTMQINSITVIKPYSRRFGQNTSTPASTFRLLKMGLWRWGRVNSMLRLFEACRFSRRRSRPRKTLASHFSMRAEGCLMFCPGSSVYNGRNARDIIEYSGICLIVFN